MVPQGPHVEPHEFEWSPSGSQMLKMQSKSDAPVGDRDVPVGDRISASIGTPSAPILDTIQVQRALVPLMRIGPHRALGPHNVYRAQ